MGFQGNHLHAATTLFGCLANVVPGRDWKRHDPIVDWDDVLENVSPASNMTKTTLGYQWMWFFRGGDFSPYLEQPVLDKIWGSACRHEAFGSASKSTPGEAEGWWSDFFMASDRPTPAFCEPDPPRNLLVEFSASNKGLSNGVSIFSTTWMVDFLW